MFRNKDLGVENRALRSRLGTEGPSSPAVQVVKERASCSHSQIANRTLYIVSVWAGRIKKKNGCGQKSSLKVPPLREIARYCERSRSGRDDRVWGGHVTYKLQ
jgi:hypothetical protein